jgi:hypothetical protein
VESKYYNTRKKLLEKLSGEEKDDILRNIRKNENKLVTKQKSILNEKNKFNRLKKRSIFYSLNKNERNAENKLDTNQKSNLNKKRSIFYSLNKWPHEKSIS